MAGRRKNGTGTVRERKDGRWEGRIVVGYDDKGLPKTKSVLAKTKTEKGNKALMEVSIALNIFIVFFLALTREAYAVVIAFWLLIVKGGILLKCFKSASALALPTPSISSNSD